MTNETKTWDDITSWDDLVDDRTRDVISDLEQTGQMCPHLEKEGTCFYFCDFNLPDVKDRDRIPSVENPVYLAQQKAASLILYCMGDFESCPKYKHERVED